jgi:hypothetical protein
MPSANFPFSAFYFDLATEGFVSIAGQIVYTAAWHNCSQSGM